MLYGDLGKDLSIVNLQAEFRKFYSQGFAPTLSFTGANNGEM